MSNIEIYNAVFMETLDLAAEELNDGCTVKAVKNWDSIGHVSLVSALEDQFDIMLDTDDIISFDSYCKGKEILRKYDIEL